LRFVFFSSFCSSSPSSSSLPSFSFFSSLFSFPLRVSNERDGNADVDAQKGLGVIGKADGDVGGVSNDEEQDEVEQMGEDCDCASTTADTG